ncbi:hypothetical protein A8B79_09265 [Balneola sp. EhC07]|uniref:hypothetical protein n=1 Tax=Balneola sp. EhC07 TaxID=1849360 RepID=UPI0007F4A3C4|nr:hypothetical protein [Balneola sp. EhC07]OAN60701.1 hypothetical protein A8B79_09265 [Balneola sp. EhC07]
MIEYDYGLKIVTTFENGHSGDSYKYYNANEKLVESVGYESRNKFKYDSLGVLKEVFRCRMYNCEFGIRELLIYDNSGNNIGSYTTTDSLVNVDTADFIQTKFYNSDNQLTHELTDRGMNYHTKEKFEKWSFYEYEDDLIKKEFQKINSDTEWTGLYFYNSNDLLRKIEYWNDKQYRFITYRYNEDGKLISKILESGPEELADNVAFNVNNNKRKIEYDNLGRISVIELFNHKEELQWHKKHTYFKH